MASFDFEKQSHRRRNQLTGDWVLVSPGRAARPWKGQTEAAAPENVPAYDPQCYMCPGNKRASGKHNPNYTGTFVFENDYAALQPGGTAHEENVSGLLVARAEKGNCRVVCFSPRHDLTLARMSVDEIKTVVGIWCEEFSKLSAQPNIHSIQIFENRGAMMGCSNPHPHGQIWANESVPEELAHEVATQREYFQKHEANLLDDYLQLELSKQERVVCANDHFAVVVPFWAVWPYETLLISRRSVGSLPELNEAEREGLAQILRQVTIRYDNLFKTSFPYTMGFHQRPTDEPPNRGFHLHAHFYPPLLRSATVKKFMVGYEMLAMPQRDISPESAAEQLRDLPDVHYLEAR